METEEMGEMKETEKTEEMVEMEEMEEMVEMEGDGCFLDVVASAVASTDSFDDVLHVEGDVAVFERLMGRE